MQSESAFQAAPLENWLTYEFTGTQEMFFDLSDDAVVRVWRELSPGEPKEFRYWHFDTAREMAFGSKDQIEWVHITGWGKDGDSWQLLREHLDHSA